MTLEYTPRQQALLSNRPMTEAAASAQGEAIKAIMERDKVPFEQAVNTYISLGVKNE